MQSSLETRAPTTEAPARSFKYQAFISYRRETDTNVASELLRALEAYRIPTAIQRQFKTGKRCGRVFMDTAELSAASSLPNALKAALDDSQYLIVVCSPAAVDRPWIDQEIRRFVDTGRTNRILAVLTEGTPEQSFPAELRELNPLAVDLRAHSGYSRRRLLRTERLRLLAPIIGCDFDTLRQRDGDRARARLRWLALGMSAVAGVAIVVAVYVLRLRAESERRRSVAEARLATASQTIDEVNHIIQDEVKHGGEPELVKMALLKVVGDAQRALAASGADGRDERLIDMMTHFQRGEIARRHHDSATAAREYRGALQISGPALQLSPKDVPIRQDMALMHERLATIAQEAGDRAGARRELESAIRTNEEILKDAPANTGVRTNLGKEYVQRGQLQEIEGKDGVEDYTKAIGVLPDAVDAKSTAWFDNLVSLALAYRERGRALTAHDQLQKGLSDLRKARDLSEQGMESFPSLYPFADLVIDYIGVARAEDTAGNLGDAVNDLQAGLKAINQWRRQNVHSVAVVEDEWRLHAMLLFALARLHRTSAVTTEVDAYLAVDAERVRRLEHTAQGVEQHVRSSLQVAAALQALGEVAAARKLGVRALEVLNLSFEGEKSRLRESRMLLGFLPTLAGIIGVAPFLPEFARAAEGCRDIAEKVDRDGALRCGYRATTFGRLSMALGFQSEARRALSIATRYTERLKEDPGLDVLRLRVATQYLSVLVAIPQPTPDAARSGTTVLVEMSRALVAARAATPNDPDSVFDPVLLAEALVISVGLTDAKQLGDRHARELGEAITLLTPAEDATGSNKLVAASATLMLAKIEMSAGNLAAARHTADALDLLLQEPIAGNATFGLLQISSIVFATELAATMGDAPACRSALKKLEEIIALAPNTGALAPTLKVARNSCEEATRPKPAAATRP